MADTVGNRARARLRLLLLALVWGILGACTHIYTAKGLYYRVQPTDTLETIANKYKTGAQDLAEINNIQNVEDLRVGRSLYIPGITPSIFAEIIEKERKLAGYEPKKKHKGWRTRGKKSSEKVPAEIETEHDRFLWPVEGELSSLYGVRRGRRHDGIDIRARRGTPVKASADGDVVYSRRMRGYGNLVILDHGDDFFTVYAHNSVNLVKKGQRVKKGDMISKVGSTGRATGPHLHFEVREGSKSRNPLFLLPKNQYAEKTKEKETDYGGPEEENP